MKPVSKINMNWKQAKRAYPKLKPMGDIDKDGVKNKFDCKPFNYKKQGSEHDALSFAREHDWGEESELEDGRITNLKETSNRGERTVSRKASINSLRKFGGY